MIQRNPNQDGSGDLFPPVFFELSMMAFTAPLLAEDSGASLRLRFELAEPLDGGLHLPLRLEPANSRNLASHHEHHLAALFVGLAAESGTTRPEAGFFAGLTTPEPVSLALAGIHNAEVENTTSLVEEAGAGHPLRHLAMERHAAVPWLTDDLGAGLDTSTGGQNLANFPMARLVDDERTAAATWDDFFVKDFMGLGGSDHSWNVL